MLSAKLERTPAWEELYRLQGLFLVLLVCFIPVVETATAWLGPSSLLPVSALYGGVLLFVQRSAIDWKCPRCRNPFLRRRGTGFALPFRGRCGTCGLKCGVRDER